jgi:hypothetical protein
MITRFHLPKSRRKNPPEPEPGFGAVFRRFFDLIERLDPPPEAPETKARITRLDPVLHRPAQQRSDA